MVVEILLYKYAVFNSAVFCLNKTFSTRVLAIGLFENVLLLIVIVARG